MDNGLKFEIEALIDRHGLSAILNAMAETCHEKSAHVAENWQDKQLAREWTKCARVAELAQNKMDKLTSSMSAGVFA